MVDSAQKSVYSINLYIVLDFENIIKNLCLPLLAKKRIFDIMDLRKLNEYELYNEDIDKLSIIKKIELLTLTLILRKCSIILKF